ncbi:MAG: hypothetical protein C0594_09105, partial [Marinilabiliales bacterium]
PTSWSWTFSGGTPVSSTDQNPTGIVYSTAGVYDVSLTISDGSNNNSQTKLGYIIVGGTTAIDADFEGDNLIIMPGDAVNFTDLTSGTFPVEWSWNFDGGTPGTSNSQNPVNIVYNIPGSYDVSLTAFDGINQDVEMKADYITVMDSSFLEANFTADQTVITLDQTVTFTDLSVGAIVEWDWTFTGGDPADDDTQTPPEVSYTATGSYDVELIVTDTAGVSNTLLIPNYITVIDPVEPVANFMGNPLLIAPGNTVDFTDLSQNAPTSWSWKFFGGTPGSSNQQNPVGITYNSPGFYDVRLIVSNSAGADTMIREVYVEVVDPTCPEAEFETEYTVVPAGDTIIFTDLSANQVDSWSWTFEGAEPVSSDEQNPDSIVYANPGWYDVALTVTNGCGSDTESKPNYIRVVNSDSIGANFVASQVILTEGDTIYFTDLSVGNPTTWDWSFEGAIPLTSSEQHPDTITYHTAGVYDVMLIVQKGLTYDTLLREDYIIVLQDGNHPPQADFTTDYTTIPKETSINFYDLSIDGPTDWKWIFEGANPGISTNQNPVNVYYETVGYYDATLIVSNILGTDTIVKEDYIHVIDPDSVSNPPVVDFTASERLIYAGQTIFFQDLSTNDPTAWEWEIEVEPGVYETKYMQNPTAVTYNIPGLYDVKLKAANALGIDSLIKTQYIVVSDTSWADPRGYCDTITNFEGYLSTFYHLEYTWGYFPGHNGDRIKGYADRYVNYTFSEISAIIVPVIKTVPGEPDSYVRFKVWEGDEYPTTEITSKKVELADLYPNTYCYVEFDSVIPIDGKFFIGYELRYAIDDAPQDTFVVAMMPDRGPDEFNSLYIKRASNWFTPHEYYLQYDENDIDINSSLGIKVIGCLVGIDEEENTTDDEILVFPNPSSDFVYVNLGYNFYEDVEIAVYDMLGNRIVDRTEQTSDNNYSIDFRDLSNGMYFINVMIEDRIVSKKVTIIK